MNTNNRLRTSGALTTRTKTAIRSSHHKKANTSREIPSYQTIKVLGRGAFGVVCCARDPHGNIVAVKKVKIDPTHKNRELDILKLLNHKNCISLKNSFKTSGSQAGSMYLNIVMDFLPMSLHQFAASYRKNRKFPPLFYVKLYSYQMFTGLNYLHSIGVTHRDIKPENVIVDPSTGELKVCDLGSAKMLSPDEESIAYIASRYYRAPELIMGCTNYTSAIDIWAAGCVIVELLNAGSPIFPGRSSKGQLTEIVSILGQPSREDLASFSHPPMKVTTQRITTLEASLPKHTPPDILDLLSKIFVYNPNKRLTAEECMRHPCFSDLFTRKLKMPNGNRIPTLEDPYEN
ncbi:CMGC family protein kinase [Tritrichomonas foetus]|uniref:non-specific serine/threonine protein kinase n=1 Tax=Tritrichomonas foetus TaxID=1144522 RepID=A0A1J4KNT2_9EUKA|nr:CMGC family protein kinase [Tritrichomonas foetus]|eukprot:OHT11358.1 CMGC family protein kinase [Tritrichomonas foetus]